MSVLSPFEGLGDREQAIFAAADALARGDARSSAPAARLHRRHRHRRDGECARARDIATNLAIDDDKQGFRRGAGTP